MSSLAWFEICTLGLPVVYLVGLGVRKRRRRREAARVRNKCSVAAISRRIAREREHEEAEQQPARWPRADPDRGVIWDERPTLVLPQVGRHAWPDDDTVPLVVRPMNDSAFLPFHIPQRKARP